MNKYLIFLILISCNPVFAQNEYKFIDSLIQQLSDNGEFNGIALIGNGDTILFSNSYGYANLEKKTKIDLNTQFYIASISKQFTATAILQLVENNKIKLDQSVKSILPLFPYDGVSIHHLLSNTSGISDYIDYFAENWNKRLQTTTDDVLDYLYDFQPMLRFEAGSKFEYSNTNYVILAKIIELISNLSYPSFLRENIFHPCGMYQSYASYKPYFTEKDKNSTSAYVQENNTWIRNDLSVAEYIDRVNYLSGIQGDGSIVTSINDLFVWHKALLSNKVLSTGSQDLLFSPTVLSDGSKSYYGYGWYIDNEIVDHTGSWPGYQTRIIRNLRNGKVGITFKNMESYNWSWIYSFDQYIRE